MRADENETKPRKETKMTAKQARTIIAEAVAASKISREEAGRRHDNITRISNTARGEARAQQIAIWVADLI